MFVVGFLIYNRKLHFNSKFLALMEVASFWAGVQPKRYNGQQELAPKKNFETLNGCNFETSKL